MILIITDSTDCPTSRVINWLLHWKKPFLRVNGNDELEPEINVNKTYIIKHKDVPIDLSRISSYWYRRGFINISATTIQGKHSAIDCQNNHLQKENKEVENYLNFYLTNISNSLGSYSDNHLNKLEVLSIAVKYGLDIPDTIITTKKSKVLDFIKIHSQIIAKAVSNGFSFQIENYNYYLHTILIEEKDIIQFPDIFPLSLFQECLNKKYELRIFYLDGICYSSVIFSQNDPKTSIDFRNYNDEKPNRVCPFKLPKNIEEKIIKLMNHFKMRTGSLDIVVTQENKYVFLEVNPIGQFKQVTEPCNYHLEKLIAEKLC